MGLGKAKRKRAQALSSLPVGLKFMISFHQLQVSNLVFKVKKQCRLGKVLLVFRLDGESQTVVGHPAFCNAHFGNVIDILNFQDVRPTPTDYGPLLRSNQLRFHS